METMENIETFTSASAFLAGNKIRLIVPSESSDLTLYNGTPKYCCSLTYKPLNIDKTVTDTTLGPIWLISKDRNAANGGYIDITLPNNLDNLDAKVIVALYAYDPARGFYAKTNEPKEKTKASDDQTIYVFANQAPTLSIDSINWTTDTNYPATIVYNITPGLVNPSGWASASGSRQSYWNDFQSCFETRSSYIEATMSLVYSSVDDFDPSSISSITTTSISNFQVSFSIPSSTGLDANKTWYFKTTIQYNNDPSRDYNVYSSEVKSDSKILPPNTPQLQIQKNGIKVNVVKTDNDNSAAIQVRKIETNTSAGYNLALYDDTRRSDGALNNNPNIGFFKDNALAADMRINNNILKLKHRGRDYYDTIVTAVDLLNTLTPNSISTTNVSATNASATNASISNTTITNLSVTHITNSEIPVGGIYKGASAPSTYGSWEPITDITLIDKAIFRVFGNDNTWLAPNVEGYLFANLYHVTSPSYTNMFEMRQSSFEKIEIDSNSHNYGIAYYLQDNYTVTLITRKLKMSGHFENNNNGIIWFTAPSASWYGYPSGKNGQEEWVHDLAIFTYTGSWDCGEGVCEAVNPSMDKLTFSSDSLKYIVIPDQYINHINNSANFKPADAGTGCTCTIEVYGYPNQWRRIS